MSLREDYYDTQTVGATISGDCAETVRHTLHICCNIHKLSASYKRIILRADNTDSLTPSRLDNELLQGQIYLS